MSLRSTPVSKCLDKRLLLFGFEVLDVLAIFLTLSILNLLFGRTGMLKLLFVWAPTLAVAGVLWLGKRGKPDNYLVHWIRFQFKPGRFSAFTDASVTLPPPRLGKGAVA
jgi:hypothetical protein